MLYTDALWFSFFICSQPAWVCNETLIYCDIDVSPEREGLSFSGDLTIHLFEKRIIMPPGCLRLFFNNSICSRPGRMCVWFHHLPSRLQMKVRSVSDFHSLFWNWGMWEFPHFMKHRAYCLFPFFLLRLVDSTEMVYINVHSFYIFFWIVMANPFIDYRLKMLNINYDSFQ